MIKELDWDSEFFQKRIGKVEVDTLLSSQLIKIIEEKETDRYDLIYLFVNKVEKEAEQLLFKLKKQIIDQRVTYTSHNISNSNYGNSYIVEHKEGLNHNLLRLALLSGHQSRFKKDPLLNPKFELLYTNWIEKSLSGEMADIVLTSVDQNTIQGFVTAKKDSNNNGQIGLIAVTPSAHGKGVGSDLIESVHHWYHQNNITTASVVTQLNNLGACKLYEKMGYEQSSIKLIYHL